MIEEKHFSTEAVKRKLERYCVYQDRCHKDVETKLRAFLLTAEAKDEVVLHLLEHNFLNEERFSKSFARGKFSIKKWGKQRIIRELKFREIASYTIKVGLKEIDEALYLKTLFEITAKKNNVLCEPDSAKRKKKLIDFLLRKGYEYDATYRVVHEILG